ncbi:MAG: C39 family peptidase [Candidatus Dormibacteraeota bacterium]|nr:C39 family peptidase [Candidatus Dormibacteraeota bacterium]
MAAVILALTAVAPAMRAAAAPSAQPGGVVLDGWGGLHTFGGFTLAQTGAPYWYGWDIARAMVIRDDGSGGWTLDGYGGIHAFGAAAPITTPVWTNGVDDARDFAVTSFDQSGLPTGAAGYLLTADGVVHAWGGAPALSVPATWPGQDMAQGLLVHFNGATPDGAWILLTDGSIESVGAAPPISLQDERVPPGWRHLHANADGTMWAVDGWGVTAGAGAGSTPAAAPETQSWAGYSDWGGWNILRDLYVSPLPSGAAPTTTAQPVSTAAVTAYRDAYRPPGGVTLDGYGGLHTFGGYPLNNSGASYWPGWDIAQALVLQPQGVGGWTLDGDGGIHAFGGAQGISDEPYWQGWDIARDVVMTSRDTHGNIDGRQGYVLDGWGGVHAFGGAPQLATPQYWEGWDIARGLDVHLSSSGTPDGVLVIDAYGGLHYSGAYPQVTAPAYHDGQETYERMQRTSDGHLYAVTHFGIAVSLGSEDITTAPWPSPSLAPHWSGYADWGVWDIIRDVALGRTDNGSISPQPLSLAATNALQDREITLSARTLNAPAIRQDMPLDCESASTAAALNLVGSGASQDWVFSQLPVDARPPVMSGGVPAIWGDAWTSFVGNVWGSEPGFTGYGVYYGPIASVVSETGHAVWGGQDWTLGDMMAEIDRGHPVIIWVSDSWRFSPTSTWTGFDGVTVPYTTTDHTVLLYGVDPGAGTISLMDVGTGTYRTFSWGQFASFMATWANMAVAVS